MDLSKLENTGIAIFNDDETPLERTTLIVGLPRSGTTMPATVLHHLGMFMGDGIGKGVFEDARLAAALEKHKEKTSNVIEDYNRRFRLWGFKRPHAWEYIDKDLNKFRNPRLVVMFRDPLAIANRNHVSMGSSLRDQLIIAAERLNRLSKFAIRNDLPVMLVSYEKVISAPEHFVRSLSKFSGINAPHEKIEIATSKVQNGPEDYLKSSQIMFPKHT